MARAPKTRVKAGTSKAAAAARRRSFAQAYIANGRNGTQAAITAGFSPKGADVAAARMLGNAATMALIDDLMAAHSLATGLAVERTLQEVARVGYFDPRKLYRDNGTLKRPDEWDADTAAGVASIEIVEEFTGNGEDRRLSGYTTKIKLRDKNAALEKGMKHLGLYERDNAQRSENLMLKVELV